MRLLWSVIFGGLLTRAIQRVRAVTAPRDEEPKVAQWADLQLGIDK